MSSRFQTVRDIIDYLARLHHDLSARYGSLAERHEDNERVTLVLRYLERNEELLRQTLESFGKNADPGLLNTWFNNVPNLENLMPETIPVNDADELVSAALAVDEQLRNIYQQLAARAAVPSVRELFEDLAHKQRKDESRLALANLRLSDI